MKEALLIFLLLLLTFLPVPFPSRQPILSPAYPLSLKGGESPDPSHSSTSPSVMKTRSFGEPASPHPDGSRPPSGKVAPLQTPPRDPREVQPLNNPPGLRENQPPEEESEEVEKPSPWSPFNVLAGMMGLVLVLYFMNPPLRKIAARRLGRELSTGQPPSR